MSLPNRVALIVVTVFVLSGLLSFGIQRWAILPSFQALEKETAEKNAQRVLEAINRELHQIGPLVSDWALWTETYQFAKGENPDYVEENLDDGATLAGMQMNYLGIYDTSGTAVWIQSYDLEEERLLDLGALTADHLKSGHPLLQHPELTGQVKGLIDTMHGPLLVLAKPILTNEGLGPPAGTMIMGRFLNEAAAARLAEQTQLPLILSPAGRQAPSVRIDAPRKGLAHSKIELVDGADQWQAHSTLFDLFGQPLLSVQVATPRDITSRGVAAVNSSLYSLGLSGLTIMTVVLLLLRRTVLRPIAALTDNALKIGADDNLHTHLELDRKDEFGVLSRTFDDMVDRLAEARRRLVDQSFHSGMAEMASGVLHNIGNTITPLKVNLSALQRDLAAAPVAEMEQAAAELAASATPEERRADLAQFVELAGVDLAGLVKSSREAVADASQQVEHVQEILADQERFSRSARVMEPVDMDVVFRDAAAGLSPQMKAAVTIDISPSVSETGAVIGARTALQQVATNLLVNAAESIFATGSDMGRISVNAAQGELDGQLMLHLQVEDNGAGIQPEDQQQLFKRGFSTKDRDGSGNGLHWSANTIQALNGRITFDSQGEGRGACLHIWLPMAQPSIRQATGTEG